jgi:hypothetical protein
VVLKSNLFQYVGAVSQDNALNIEKLILVLQVRKIVI